MFRFARFIVQQKIGLAAVVALGVVYFAPGNDDHAKSSNPWSAPTPIKHVAAEDAGVIDQIVDKADTMLAESGYDPRESAEMAADGYQQTSSSLSKANAR